MQFEWDERKRTSNREKHGIDFEDAPAVFSPDMIVFEDHRREYGEQRYIGMGTLCGRIVVTVFTVRGDTVRIISMRKANRREAAYYEKTTEDRS
ncbi:MAG: BrnT family toxin [Desulfovibrionaceae bacterium]|nr:BrnT family toxin [Desulfovibrionaceae bacterium]MBF0513508.1 BrnT family toxin [Desulfovibrionaceae bacterium]